MQDLRVIGVENGALLVVSDGGERYRIPIDEVLQSKLRQSQPEPGAGRKLSPREIQAHIRSGMSAQDVSSITGVPIDYIQRFEGPVLAEREFVVETALGVRVHTALETDPLVQGATFGAAITARLHGLGAINERWASWKEQGGGWIVKLSFTADQIDHDARWSFEPRKLALAPLNQEAITLSQQGDAAGGLVPRLRAVSGSSREADSSRFDSGAFDANTFEPGALGRTEPTLPPMPDAANRFASTDDAPGYEPNQTADLLDALRRRRGEREAASFIEDESLEPGQPSGTIRLVDVPMADYLPIDSGARAPRAHDDDAPDDGRATSPQPHITSPAKARKGRTAMPSWDDIVFGARADDE